MNYITKFEQQQIATIQQDKNIPHFSTGDTLKVHVRILDETKERIQVFEGVCIARSNKGFGSSFLVRKISNGEGVERRFNLYSPIIKQIEVVRRGHVRRAKLYYLRDRSGKSARIRTRTTGAGFRNNSTNKASKGKKG